MSYSTSYMNIRNMFWDGGGFELNRSGIKASLRRALRDYTSRTQAKILGANDTSVENLFNALDPCFTDEIEKYFNSPVKSQDEYDVWHHEMCNIFIDRIEKSGIKNTETYGKAQKIVNMTMKTVFCLDGAEIYDNQGYFKHCHIPLDSITIEWFRNKLAKEWYNPTRTKQERIRISLDGGPLPKWSNLTFLSGSLSYRYVDYDKEISYQLDDKHYHYMFFVTMIREYFVSGNEKNNYDGLTPFQAEFFIWPEQQWELSANGLLNQDLITKLSVNPGVSVHNPVITDLCGKLSKNLIDISKHY